MQIEDLYTNAHLYVAAIRIWEHQHNMQPSVEDICDMLSLSIEQGNFFCRKLKEIGVIDEIESAAATRLFIKNHMNLESIPRGEADPGLEDEIKRYKSSQKNISQKVEDFKAQQEKKKKDLFAEMEKKLKKELDKK
jgi:hypothetical protein